MWGMHHNRNRFAGRSGSFRRGPFEVSWNVEGEGGQGRGFGGRGGGGGRRRMFDGEQLKLVLLALIGEGPRHGYDLIREIEERTGGAYGPSPGVVYPTLTLLDEMALIDEVKEDGARRRFAITEAGTKLLAEKREEIDALLARLTELAASRARTDRAPIRRAMTSLHMALREAMTNGETDRTHAITAILDEATQKIERLEAKA